jgi:hypothetical protein
MVPLHLLRVLLLLVMCCLAMNAILVAAEADADHSVIDDDADISVEDEMFAAARAKVVPKQTNPFVAVSSLRRFTNKLKHPGTVSSLALGGTVLAGGLMGYIRKGSVPSLVGSAAISAGLFGGSALIVQDEELSGHAVAALSSGSVIRHADENVIDVYEYQVVWPSWALYV